MSALKIGYGENVLWLIIGYLFLFIFRPYEYWPVLGEYRIERIYVIIVIICMIFWQKKRYVVSDVTRNLLAFFVVMIVSASTSIYFDKAYDVTYEYFKLIIFYLGIILTIQDKEQLKKFVLAYLLIMLLYVGKSSWEYFVNGRHIYRMGISRMIGIDTTYGDANSFSASIVYSMPFLWVMLREKFYNPWVKRLLIVYAMLAPICIVFTGSRSGMLTALLFVLILMLKSKRILKSILVTVVLLSTVWLAMPDEYKERFITIFVKSEDRFAVSAETSAQGRIDGLMHGLRLFSEHPVLGVGPGNFKYSWERGMNSHNLYGQLLGELGSLGAISFLMFVASMFVIHKKVIVVVDDTIQNVINYNNEILFYKYISTASIQVIILLLFNGNFGHNLYRYNWLWLGAIGVLSFHMVRDHMGIMDESSS